MSGIWDLFRVEVDTPTGWLNVTGDGRSVQVTRRDTEPGTMTAEVLDAALDPTQTNTIRMGKGSRFLVRDAAGTGWVDQYTGVLTDVSVARSPLAQPGKRVSVALQAADRVAELANRAESRGVATIDALRWLVTGVPFNINGQTTALAAQPVVAGVDGASLWDQILVVRDSNLGHAWVGKSNRLQVWDAATLSAVPVAVIGPDVYSSIDTDFALDSIINSVTVVFRRFNIGTEMSTDVPYGPYEDAASVAEWGRRAATFTIQGGVEDAVAIEAFAADVLARNAAAVVRARSARVPIHDAADLAMVRAVELNNVVTVVLPDAAEQTLRVKGISHSITQRGWFVDFTFTQAGSVGAPLVTVGAGAPLLPPGSVTENELGSEFKTRVSEIEASIPVAQANAQTYSDQRLATEATRIDSDVAAVNSAMVAGDTKNSQAIDAAVADFNAGLATKSKHTLSPNAPGATANNAGDVWERHKAGDATKIIGRWRGAGGTAWTVMNLDATYIPQLDIATGTFGDLSGSRLEVNTIATNRLAVADWTNYAIDFNNQAQRVAYQQGNGHTWSYSSVAGEGWRMRLLNPPQYARWNLGEEWSVKPGDQYHVSFEGFRVSGDKDHRLTFASYDEAGTWKGDKGLVGDGNGADTAGWQTYQGTVTIPAGVYRVRANIFVDTGATAGEWFIRKPIVRRMNGGELIVDGSVLARHFTGDTFTGVVMTAPLLQTRPENNRGIKIVSSANGAYGSLIAYNDGGGAVMTVNGQTGDIVLKGSLTAGSSLIGGTVRGGVVETEAAAQRGIKMTSAGLIGYDTAGVATTVIDPSTGRFSGKGGLATATGFDDLEIVAGNSATPSAVRFMSDGARYDLSTPANVSCFDTYVDAGLTTYRVQLQGAKAVNQAARPRIDIGTHSYSTGPVQTFIEHHAGQSGGISPGGHYFYIDGTIRGHVQADGIATNAGFKDTGFLNGGLTGASINDVGRIVRTSSSERYKQRILPLDLAAARPALALEPVTFEWRDTKAMGAGRYPGFIAEQVHDAGAGLWVNYDLAGRPDGVRYAELTAALVALVKDHDARLALLEGV